MDEIILGDAYELIKEIPDKSVDLIVTDPPYLMPNNGLLRTRYMKRGYHSEIETIADGFDESILGEFVRVMKGINIYLWCNKEQIPRYMEYFVRDRGCRFEIIIWGKTNPIPMANNHYLPDKEYCLLFRGSDIPLKPTCETGRTIYMTEINKADKEKYLHPTIKPEPIIENLILNSSNEGDVVLDPFSGSGTTCAVAKRLGRHYIGFEISPRWHKVSLDRLEGITQKEAELGYVQERLF